MQRIDPLFKKHHEKASNRFGQRELRERLNIVLTIIIVLSLIVAAETIGFY